MTKMEIGVEAESVEGKPLNPGDLVWAKMKGFPYWPGRVALESEMPAKQKKKGSLGVFFFGSNNYSYVDEKFIKDYFAYRSEMPPQKGLWKTAVEEIEKYIAEDSNLIQRIGAAKPSPDPQELQEEIRKLAETADTDDDKDSNSSKRSLSKMDDTTPPSSDSPKSQKTDKKLAATDGRNAPSLKRNSSAAGLNGCPASSSKLSPAAASLASPQSVRKTNVKGCGKTVGFIGLGNMGCAMVKNLISQSHTVFLYNRSSEKYAQFAREPKVKKTTSPAHLLRECDVIFSCLSDESAVEEIMGGPEGLLSGMKSHKSYVEMTTVSVKFSLENSRKIAAKGGRYLEAPILGSTPTAEDGTLVFLCAGDRTVFEECESMFSAMSKRALYMGEVGNGAKAKLIHQQLQGVITAGVAEALVLADRIGVSQQDMADIFEMTPMSSVLLKNLVKEITESVFSPSFKLEQMQSELQMVSNLGHTANQHLPVSSAANELFKSAKRKGEAEMDFTAVYRALDL